MKHYRRIVEGDRLFDKSEGTCNALLTLDLPYAQSTSCGRKVYSRRSHALDNWKSMRIDGDMHQIITAGIGHLKTVEADQTVCTPGL